MNAKSYIQENNVTLAPKMRNKIAKLIVECPIKYNIEVFITFIYSF